jgi:hypothetical protein
MWSRVQQAEPPNSLLLEVTLEVLLNHKTTDTNTAAPQSVVDTK